MAATRHGGVNGTAHGDASGVSQMRFSDIPTAIDIPVSGLDAEEAVEVHLAGYLDDPTELCQLLENEKAAKNLWITIALAYAKQAQLEHAIDILKRGLASLDRGAPKDRLSLFSAVAWLQLLQSRQAPRVLPEGSQATDVKTKDKYLLEAIGNINESLRINPAFPPLHLTRGVHQLLRASLISSTKTGAGNERADALNQALKSFDDALRASNGRNMMAVMGRARVLFMQGRYAQALHNYQEVLSKMPSMTDPDPRIGIGCCLWHLGYHDRAQLAWERALVLNPGSKVAHSLLGVYYLHESSKVVATDPRFNELYKKAISEHIQKAYAIDKNFPLSCAVFASYFLLTSRFETVEPLARTAIEKTDINAVASDGWYLLARKEHTKGDIQKATDYYNRADLARGGGFLPAKFGLAQLLLQKGDMENAKYNLDKLSNQKSIEVKTIQGCILAEENFAAEKAKAQDVTSKEKLADSLAKATKILEEVRKTWKEDNSKSKPDETVLLYLARLYEAEKPIDSLKCLQEVEVMQTEKIPDDERPPFTEEMTDAEYSTQLRERLPPQLLNNMACFFYGAESFDIARETFEIALSACVKLQEKQDADKEAAEEGTMKAEDVDTSDTDALVTTISYNLGRTYEALGLLEEAQNVYAGLLNRHKDYADASARLAYVSLERDPRGEGPKKMITLYNEEYANVEIRALMGWYYHGSKKKAPHINEDQEYRHYKHTLQNYEKHDVYALVGMGNIIIANAREMPRNTDAERQKRSDQYKKAFEFFDKALHLDPKNAYAAQGIAIALCDDKRDYSEAVQILSKLKETIRDTSVYTNLGHVMTELKQYQRGIDNYDIALAKDKRGDAHGQNPQLLACLSRAWMLKGKAERSTAALKTSLDYMDRALATQPESQHLKFNVAFIQFQVALQINAAKESERSVVDINTALAGLDAAIATFEEVMVSPAPPYPADQLQQRVAMGRNTMKKQLSNALASQQSYENENQTKLAEAKAKRLAEQRIREEAEERRRAQEQEARVKQQEERRKMIEETERLARELRAEQVAREAAEWTEDDETGERVKRKEKKKAKGGKGKRKRNDEDGFIEDDEQGGSSRSVSRTPASGVSDDEPSAESGNDSAGPKKRKEQPKKKKRKLERKAKPENARASNKQFKSAEKIVDSDEEGNAPTPATEPVVDTPKSDADEDMDGNEDEMPVAKPQRQRKQLRTIADDDDDDDDEDEMEEGGVEGAERTNEELADAALRAVEGEDDDE